MGNLSTEVWLQKQPKTSTRKWCSFGEQVIPAQMYFYVLKGIRNIEYFYTRTSFHPGGPHKVVKDVDVNGDWVSVPVPSGMGGKIWSYQNPVVGVFNFNNIPNYYVPAPDGLLVPRETAQKDALALRK